MLPDTLNLMRAALLLLLAATALPAQSVSAAPASPLDPLHFLLGTWTAKTTPGGSSRASSTGEYTFHTDLNGTVVIRTTSADACVAPQSFSCQHHDLLTIYAEPGDTALKAIYFDNEGHIIHYKLSFPDPETAVFVSTGPGLQYRLTYHLAAEGLMTGKFQFASSGGKSGFRSYLEWSGGHPTAHDAATGPFTSSVEALRDTTRILLVFAPNSSDPPFVQQLSDFKAHEREALDRNLILVPVLSSWSPLDVRLYGANLPFTVDREQQYLRTRFKIYAGFTVILLGKDGGEKYRGQVPMSAKTLFDTIDSMPMRRLEMQGRKEPRSR